MGNRCCNKVPVQEQNYRKGDGRKGLCNYLFHVYICSNIHKIFNFQLVSGNGDIGLPSNPRNDIQYTGGASSRLPSQDIIRHPSQSPMRPPTNSTRLESPNGFLTFYLFLFFPRFILQRIILILGLLSGPRMLIALYDYNAREISDMSFRKGDRMELLDDRYESIFLQWFVNIILLFKNIYIYIWLVILIGGKLNILLPTKLDMFRETLLQWNNRWRAMSN